jgi:hypothetical protein
MSKNRHPQQGSDSDDDESDIEVTEILLSIRALVLPHPIQHPEKDEEREFNCEELQDTRDPS